MTEPSIGTYDVLVSGELIPADPRDLTVDALTELLASTHPGAVVDRVAVLDVKRCGEGAASTADRVDLGLTYRSGGDGLPSRMLLKTLLLTARAPAAMYENEVRFYREIRPGLSVETPEVFGCHYDPDRGRFALLLEDLSLRSARFPASPDELTDAQAESLVDLFVELHSSQWMSERFDHQLAWLPTHLDGGMADVFELLGHELIADQLAKHPAKREYVDRVGCSFDRLWYLLGVAQRELAAAPATLLHGDPHLGNTYTLGTDRAGLLDWQLVTRGCWAHDLTYLLTTGLSAARRRELFDPLLDRYLDGMSERDVLAMPDRAEAVTLCRAAALWGLVIGWLITPPENYGWVITAANLDRVSTAVVDLETIDVLDSLAASHPG